jgi:hypothetical protein
MKNREVYWRDPLTAELLNNGVSKVSETAGDPEQVRTLRFELETFVCDGEYARGLERILKAYLDGLNREEQRAVWVSGFFGSGKSHLVKMLRYLWEDYRFPDDATARSIAKLPSEVSDLLTELTNRSKAYGGLRAAAGTLGAGAMDNVRLAFLQLVLRSAGLPETLAQARFLLWLSSSGLSKKVEDALKHKDRNLQREVRNLKLSTPLAEALLEADPKYGTVANAQAALRAEFPDTTSPTINESLELIRQVFGKDGKLPCTLLVVDEVQQFIGERIPRAMDIQEIAEHCCTNLDRRLLLVGTGQSALTTTASLGRLQARFAVRVQLSDTDVETVIRKTVLHKKPEREEQIRRVIEANQGEISRHLQNTRLAASHEDEPFYVPDYPLLPTRRRFWERVLRSTDHSGTSAQLRTQLKIVFDATRETAERSIGTVVPADFIYDQIATDLINTGELERVYDEIIKKQRDKTPQGELRSRLCALIFLINKLPRTSGADDGVRANVETLADLLVADLTKDGATLRQEIPTLLRQLVDAGHLMMVESEYRLQTPEGAKWTHEFNRRRTGVLNDEARINGRRDELVREAVDQALKPVSLSQGQSRQPRKLLPELATAKPAESKEGVTFWLRDGWNDEERTVLNDARAAGTNSPMLFGYLPRLCHEELRQAIAEEIAANETLIFYGGVTTPEAIEPRKAVETHLTVASDKISKLLGQIVGGAKVFLGGGEEASDVELAKKVDQAGHGSLERLFPKFSDADHANWGQVVNRARGGDVGALSQIGYRGETSHHPVCRQVIDVVGAGKKGRDVREHFKSAPFGWSQDVVDSALYTLMVAGNIRATLNGQPVQIKDLPQNQVGAAHFYVDVPPLNVSQRLDLKALFQKAGVATKNGEESSAAVEFLTKLRALADSAGGEPPRPTIPDTQAVQALQVLSGNAQLVQIHGKKAELEGCIAAWKKAGDGIAKRLPAWERLLEFSKFGSGMPEAKSWSESIEAITKNRSLLHEPDPVPPLIHKMTQVLRDAMTQLQRDVTAAFEVGERRLEQSDVWQRSTSDQRNDLTAQFQLTPPAMMPVGTEQDILSALRSSSLSERRNLLDAIPQRFTRALEEATRLLEPKAVRVTLPSATIKNEAELDAWLDEARERIIERLKDGPVIL